MKHQSKAWNISERILCVGLLASPLALAATNVVSLGAQSPTVAKIQQQLVDLGYDPGAVNGRYGTLTMKAVWSFQLSHHIVGKGGVGSKTEAALEQQLALKYPPTHYAWDQGIVKAPQYGEPVVIAQQDLIALGYYRGGVDGVFNRGTELAVKSFQKNRGLNVTGEVGKITASALTAAVTALHPVIKPFVLGFYTQYEPNATGSQNSLATHVKQVSAISPLWYSFRADGTLHDLGYHYAAVRAYAKAHHVAVYPMIINGFENAAVVENPEVRQSVIAQLKKMAVVDDYAGYNIDFEGLAPDARAGMNAFIMELAAALDPMGRTISVDVPPKLSADNRYAMPYDFAVLGKYANQIILMTYDDHSVGTPAGPVAPYPWMKSAIEYAVTRMSAAKIVLGLAGYGYDWASTGQTVEYHDLNAIALAHQEGVPIEWNAVDKEFTYSYVQNGISHVVWFEDGYSDKFRMQLAREFHLGGIALWRLGDENPQFWTEVNQTGW